MTLAAVPCRGRETLIKDLFGPLGYAIETEADDVDPEGAHQDITLKATKRLSEMLTHVYVLLPVLDNRKHYGIGDAELEKLMAQGKGWLEDHPHRDLIVQRYLGHRKSLTNEAMSTLETEHDPAGDPAEPAGGPAGDPAEAPPATPPSRPGATAGAPPRRAGRRAPPATRRAGRPGPAGDPAEPVQRQLLLPARVASFEDVTRHPQNDRTRCLGRIASRRHPRPGTGRPEVHPGPEARRGTRRAPIPSPTVRRVS